MKNRPLVVFLLDAQRYCLSLPKVDRIVRVVEISPLPGAPEIVLGVINVRGQIIPVVDFRKRLGLGHRDVQLNDCLIIARTTRRLVALLVDAVWGVIERSEEELTRSDSILPDLKYIEGIAKLDDGLVFVHDLDRFLSLDEDRQLERAMAPAEPRSQG
ncbi:MAG: chemotaxis protein CheW [Acidobacteriota bacterium]